MEWQGWFSVSTTVAVLATLVFTRINSEFVLMTAVTVLNLLGILNAKEALGGFSNTGLITVAAMFIVAAGIQASGGVDLFVNRILGAPKSEKSALFRMIVPIVAFSAFLNNTPLVATMIPAVTRWSKRIGVSPSRLLMPLSYAAIVGGTITLIGTSTNLVVNGQYQLLTGKAGFKLFDISGPGLILASFAILYLIFVLPKLLPDRQDAAQQFSNPKEFTFEVAVAVNGPLVGKTIEEAGLRHLRRIYLVEIERHGGIVTAVGSEERLQGGDRLVFVGETSAIMDILRINGLVSSDGSEPVISKKAPERRLVEAVVSPHCDCIGQSIRNSRFRDRYGAVVLAVARHGEAVQGNLGSIEIQSGDLMLLEARPAFVTRQRHEKDFLLINDLDEEKPRHDLAVLSWLILLSVVGLAAFEVIDMLKAALLGAVLMVVSGCCSIADAKRSLDLGVIITIAGSFALGNALEKTGAAKFLAEQLLAFAGDNPLLLLAVTYLIVWLLTEIITNNAAAALMLPIVLAITRQLQLNPEPYVVAVMFAASASFATPLGYQTNMMIFGPGGYRFSDFLRAGIPLNLVCSAVMVTVIPFFWPLQG
ncbi:MAG: SLC13 family permease [Gammaproteobacteria bacterium]